MSLLGMIKFFRAKRLLNKAVKKRYHTNDLNNLLPIQLIVMKIIFSSITINASKKFKYITSNKFCLYDVCIFIAFLVCYRCFNSDKYIRLSKRIEFQDRLCNEIEKLFRTVFYDKKTYKKFIFTYKLNRFDNYFESLEMYYDEYSRYDISAAQSEFINIIKQERRLSDFVVLEEPCYDEIILTGFEEDYSIKMEADYILDFGLHNFTEEISQILKQDDIAYIKWW